MPPRAEAPAGGRPEAADEVAEDVADEVAGVFGAYERALARHDVEALDGFFLDSPLTRRFGLADEQQGADAVRRWRRQDRGVPPGRWLEATQVQVLTADVAVVTTRFGYGGGRAAGRQTQVWLRTGGGWRIASAHVSEAAG